MRSEQGVLYLKNLDSTKTKPFLQINEIIPYQVFIKQSNSIFNNWFNSKEDLSWFINNFFSVYKQDGVLVENKFLTYFSIIENYHRIIHAKNTKLYQRIKRILQDSSYLNEIQAQNIDLQSILNTRHYFVHLNDEQKENALNGSQVVKLNRILEKIIRELLLREIGLNKQSW